MDLRPNKGGAFRALLITGMTMNMGAWPGEI